MKKKEFKTPILINYGSIADNTLATPHGNIKGCETNCHIDSFNENSANPTILTS